MVPLQELQSAQADCLEGHHTTPPAQATLGRGPKHNNNNKTSRPKAARLYLIGGDLLSQALASQVPSALRGLTALFGMGRGVSPSL